MTYKFPIDYHMHSTYSCDCRAPMAHMCQTALEKGIAEIAFTEHFNRHRDDMCFEKYDPAAFFIGIEDCRREFGPRGLTIKAGIEVGEMHLYRAEVDDVLRSYPFDLVLGSLHWNHGESIFSTEYFEKRQPQQMAHEYWNEMIDMINGGGFDILSHVDVVKRYAFQVYKRFDIREFEEQIRAVWTACLDKGIIPEINTSAQRMLVAQPHPTIDALCWYREMGGELLSLGSDSHNAGHLGFWFEEAIQMAKAAGFTHLAKFSHRQISDRVAI